MVFVLILPDRKIELNITRSRAPINYNRLRKLSPLESRIYFMNDDIIYLPLNVDLAIEKPTKNVKKFTIFYWPRYRCIAIALKNKTFTTPVCSLGSVSEDFIELANKQLQGLLVKIVWEEK